MTDGGKLEDLLAACSRGEQAALREIYDTVGSRLFGVALRIVRRRETAEDAVHEAFLQIWQRADSFDRNRGSAWAWIVSIVRYRALDAAMRSNREVLESEPVHKEAADSAPDGFAATALAQELRALDRCLEELPAPARSCILLSYKEGYSHTEIAERIDAPVGTVKSWIHRGVTSLRKCLDP